MTGMTEQPIDKKKLAQEKRDLARRARRLAQLQGEPDSARLTQFAAELDREAEALERLAAATMQQVQQQQSGETPTQPQLPKRNDQGLRSNHPPPTVGGSGRWCGGAFGSGLRNEPEPLRLQQMNHAPPFEDG
jgi:hypothetical protein